MKNIWMRSRIVGLLLVSLLSGCAVSYKMTAEDKQRINNIVINQDVKKPDQVYYLGSAWGMAFGAIGGAVTAVANQGPTERLQSTMTSNNILIDQIALQEVTAALKKSRKFPLAEAKGSNTGTINITVKQYGFSVKNGFSSNVLPILFISCEMVDSAGKTIWAGSERMLNLGNPFDPVPPETLLNDPKAIEKSLRDASKYLAEQIVQGL